MSTAAVLTQTRQYEQTHPWINFKLDLGRLDSRTWMLLGEAQSKCEHIAGVPLKPETSQLLHLVYLSKGAHGTTSIEGNTLSEDEVRRRVDGDLALPVSREYLGEEIDNMVKLYNQIVRETLEETPPDVSAQTLKAYHSTLFTGQPVKSDVVVGDFRDHSVGVMNYRGAPAEDCEYLIGRVCDWVREGFEPPPGREDLRFALNVLKAIMAHLYIAWIHPFGDGNGRISRLIEFQLLFQAGVPLPACHVLSDHYNRTREAYYAALDRTSKQDGFPVEVFIQYAMQGFVDELREQLQIVKSAQMEVTWENYVHEIFRDQDTPARRRQKHIALDLPAGEATPRGKIRGISPRVAEEYAGKTAKTVSRDLNALAELRLIIRRPNGVLPRRSLTSAFLAARHDPTD